MKKRYYFDYKDECGTFVDGEGDLFSDFESVEAETTKSLADITRDYISRHLGDRACDLAVNVRDEGGPVMEFSVTIKIQRRHIIGGRR